MTMLASPPLLLDTNILIYAAHGLFSFTRLSAHYRTLLISRISEVEALGFAFSTVAEEQAMQRLIAQTRVIDFTAVEARHAIAYRRVDPRFKFPDAAILATARAAGADLLTENLADFRGRDAAGRVLSGQDL